jgi:hypothetical protein
LLLQNFTTRTFVSNLLIGKILEKIKILIFLLFYFLSYSCRLYQYILSYCYIITSLLFTYVVRHLIYVSCQHANRQSTLDTQQHTTYVLYTYIFNKIQNILLIRIMKFSTTCINMSNMSLIKRDFFVFIIIWYKILKLH